jgi:hypothetical protein
VPEATKKDKEAPKDYSQHVSDILNAGKQGTSSVETKKGGALTGARGMHLPSLITSFSGLRREKKDEKRREDLRNKIRVVGLVDPTNVETKDKKAAVEGAWPGERMTGTKGPDGRKASAKRGAIERQSIDMGNAAKSKEWATKPIRTIGAAPKPIIKTGGKQMQPDLKGKGKGKEKAVETR